MTLTDNDNVGIAFALVIGAGAATGVGAAVVFFPSLVKLASRKTLAAALGLSAGVMTYVSFAEILVKSALSFEDAGFSEDRATLFSTLCFFAGVVFMLVRILWNIDLYSGILMERWINLYSHSLLLIPFCFFPSP